MTALPRQDPGVDAPSRELIGVTGVGLGTPGAGRDVFDDTNIDAILSGQSMIDPVPPDLRRQMVDKAIVRLVKRSAEFERIDDEAQVIKLAGRLGRLDVARDFGIDEKLQRALDVTSVLAMGAGLEALRDAGIPLVRRTRTTRTGKSVGGSWALPEPLRDDTGVIFASAFPGLDNLIDEVTRHVQAAVRGDDSYRFSREFLFKILSMGHAQLAQLIGARGPNTQINGACASASQALGVAEDWIRAGRCRRVLVITADDASSDHLLPWLGSGFLAAGAACTEARVEDGALPFGEGRDGMIVGAGAAAFVVEPASASEERGVRPIVHVLGAHFANSAFHGSRLDVDHIAGALDTFITRMERVHGITREEVAREGMWVSHETYTPARGGSAEAELRALEATFGTDAHTMLIINTKGFTGHAMAAGVEEAVAIRAMERGVVPPIFNRDRIDPALRRFNFSAGGPRRVRYALRMGAGFGSQLSFSLMRVAETAERFEGHDGWLRTLGGSRATLFCDGRVLKMRTLAEKAERAATARAEAAPPTPCLPASEVPDPAVLAVLEPPPDEAGYNPWRT